MSKIFVMAAVLVVALFLTPAFPAAAQGGLELGACLGNDIKGINLCLDAVDAVTCDLLCNFDGDFPEDGGLSSCSFIPGETCAEQDVPWDGACDNLDILPVPDICLLLETPQTGQSQAICEKVGGTWLGDGSVCGGVPALPKAGYAALALVLLAGTLTLLSLHGRS